LFLAPQGDLERKRKRRSKGLGEKRPNPGCFWFTAVGGRFFWRRKNFRVASLGSEWQKRRTQSGCAFVSPISHSIKVDIQRLKCNIGKQASTKQHVLALGLCD
jgi:hypothetical protein